MDNGQNAKMGWVVDGMEMEMGMGDGEKGWWMEKSRE